MTGASEPRDLGASRAGAPSLATIVMPVLDGEPFVREAVASVLAQTYTRVRLIVVDDGSRDGTAQTLASFDDDRLTVITLPENRGRTAAAGVGLAAVTTPYVGFMGADDVLLPGLVRAELDYLTAHPEVDVVSCQLQPIDSEGRELPGRVELPTEHDEIAQALLVGAAISQGGALGRTAVLARFGYAAPFDVAEDYYLWAEMLAAHLAVHRLLVGRLWPDADKSTRADIVEWLGWLHRGRSAESVRARPMMDRSLRVTAYLRDHRPDVLPLSAVDALRSRAIRQELVAWGGVASPRMPWQALREIPRRDRPAEVLRTLRGR